MMENQLQPVSTESLPAIPEKQLSIILPNLYPQIAPLLITHLAQADFTIRYAPLDSLEIQITDHVGVIRLTGWTFRHQSISQILAKIDQLIQKYDRKFIIVENYYRILIDPTTVPLIGGFLAHLAYKYRIGNIPTRGEDDTAQCLRSIAKREQIQDNPPSLSRTKPRFEVVADSQCFVVEGLLNCGPKKAHQLLTDLQSPARIFDQLVRNPGTILNLMGFGPQFLEQNFNLLTSIIHSDGTILPTKNLPEFSNKSLDPLLVRTKGRSLDGVLKS